MAQKPLDRNEIQPKIRTQETNLRFARCGVILFPGQQQLDVLDYTDRSFVSEDPVHALTFHRNGVEIGFMNVRCSEIVILIGIPDGQIKQFGLIAAMT